MAGPASVPARVCVDGKFFRLDGEKFFVKGVAYGPFAPNAQGHPYPPPETAEWDFDQIRELGVNVVRVYTVPPRELLDLAQTRGLKVWVDIPWNKHLCFLDSPESRTEARETVRRAARVCAGHPALFAYSVVNEIPPDIVRWSGTRAVAEFIDELADVARVADPGCLCTFANYPPTEFLRPQNLDFLCFNVYLHHRQPFRNYLARLQMIAEGRPLVLGEFGMDTQREGETAQAELIAWQIEYAFRGGLAGAVAFTFTDDWYRNGQPVEDWAMGLTTRTRAPKPAFRTAQQAFATAPYFPLARTPRVSVVVAGYNAARTLPACLTSLAQLNYPDYEVILVDDGSTDTTLAIAAQHPDVRYLRHPTNHGLSVARNTGIEAATGELVAFTDADCRADPDWLYYIVGDLLNSAFVGMGGPNLLPPDDSAVAAAVMASPGGPAHVMLTDRQAEHIPGCNMVFHKWALAAIGGFDPIYRRAGDDVDVCWRLQQAGYKLGFSPAGMVWHYRRPTVAAYLRQQRGYGEAEALLVRKHPEYFNSLGGGLWRGRIYASAQLGVRLRRPIIYHGPFGGGWFQTLYAAEPDTLLMLCTTLEFHLAVTLPLWVFSAVAPWLRPLAIINLLLSVAVCVTAGIQARLPRAKVRWWSRPLVALLFFLQPIVRGWARYRGRLGFQPATAGPEESLESVALRTSGERLDRVDYWSARPLDRLACIGQVLARLERCNWSHRADIGWNEFDVEIHSSPWSHLQLTTVVEPTRTDQHLLRCRLRAIGSPTARIAFGGLLAVEVLLLGWLGQRWPWLWLILLSLPLAGWFLFRQKRRLQSIVVVFLDELAEEQGWIKVRSATTQGKTKRTRMRVTPAAAESHSDPKSPFRAPPTE
ncbi:MAG: glycosyltransferase [Verrucomicrobia bacterium]|nr:glycosyltransferase [Verrucomicrobiota bacterium]